MKYYITYGADYLQHKNYSVVESDTYSNARQSVIDQIGFHWAFIYSEEGFAGQVEKYGLTEIPLQEQVRKPKQEWNDYERSHEQDTNRATYR
jgi:hypothetical protein